MTYGTFTKKIKITYVKCAYVFDGIAPSSANPEFAYNYRDIMEVNYGMLVLVYKPY